MSGRHGKDRLAEILALSLQAARAELEGNAEEKVFHILDGVFLGTKFAAEDRPLLDCLGITTVVNLSAGKTRIPNYFEDCEDIEYLHLELADELVSDPSLAFPQAVKAIVRSNATGGHVLMHCHAGLSRSACAMLAWLMSEKHMSLADATVLLTSKRGRRPRANPSFWCYLAALERELQGWPAVKKPSFDFTEWLVHDLAQVGISCSSDSVEKALREDADWTQFTLFYTSMCGWGLHLITAAQRVSQSTTATMQVAKKAAQSVLELIEVYAAWPCVQARCLRILQELLVHHGATMARRLVDEGTIGKTIHSMRVHPTQAEVQEAGIALLAYLVASDATLAEEVAKLKGLHAVVDGMQTLGCHENVQTTGCIALLCLASAPYTSKMVFNEGAVKVVLAAMRHHPKSMKVQELGCRAISAVAQDPAGRSVLIRHGGPALVQHPIVDCSQETEVR